APPIPAATRPDHTYGPRAALFPFADGGQEGADATGVHAEIAPAQARGRSHVDPAALRRGAHTHHDVVGEAEPLRAGAGLEPALRGRRGHDAPSEGTGRRLDAGEGAISGHGHTEPRYVRI